MSASEPTRLLLLRHAHAAPAIAGEKDHERSLDERGHREAENLGRLLRDREMTVARVVCSTAARTRQTLAHLGALFASAKVEFSDELYTYGADAYFAAARRAGGGSVLLVGHNPMVEAMARTLPAEPPADLGGKFRPATLAIYRVPGGLANLAPGGAEFSEVFAPIRD